ncbi:MAG: RagB/SusD family nutrient uptake outer membrane protein [Tannerellaceae bacterium]|nr:RagB/SusD family nutrient uptake outer membrane protein [Tannerellaceae bacterium]
MKFQIISLFTILLCLGSCSDWLDTEQKGITAQDNFYQTDADALAAVYAIYDSLQQGEPFLFKNFMTDEVYTGGGARGDNFGYEEINEFRHGTSNPKIKDHFSSIYKGIYLCNLAIDRLADDTETKRQVIAEAKTIRAYYYLELVSLWGRVPLVLKELQPDEYAQPNAEIAEIWAQVEQDLQEAIPVLPLKSQQSSENRVRASKGAAQAWLGKAYLYQQKYTEAAEQFEAVINSGEYGLHTDFSMLLREEQEFGVESLFEISFVADPSAEDEGNSDFYSCGPRDTHFTAGTLGIEAGYGFMQPRKILYDAFVAAGDEVRRKATILNEEEMAEYGTSVRAIDGSGTLQYGGEGYLRLKYGAWYVEKGTTWGEYGTNIRLMRYSDVLLMAAEAYNRSGNDSRALTYINQVRERVELPPLTSTGDQLFEDIKTERRLELAFEHVRYQDLIRWGDAPTVFADQGKQVPRGDGTFIELADAGWKEKNWFLPFPEDEMNVNPNIQQNPGW